MPRDLSVHFRRNAYKREHDTVVITLVTITHPLLSEPIRICDQSAAVTSRGLTFQPFPSLRPELPGDREDEMPESQFALGVVDETVIRAVSELTEPEPEVLMEVVLQSTPNDVSVSATWRIPSTRWTRQEQTAPLTLRDVLNEPIAKDRITPGNFPGAF